MLLTLGRALLSAYQRRQERARQERIQRNIEQLHREWGMGRRWPL